MSQTIRTCFAPLITMNRRVSIGGGVLALVLLSEMALAVIQLSA